MHSQTVRMGTLANRDAPSRCIATDCLVYHVVKHGISIYT